VVRLSPPAAEKASTPQPAPADTPAPPPAARGPESLEAYFDRLDAALSTLSTSPPPLETPAAQEPVIQEPPVERQVAAESAGVARPAADAGTRPPAPAGPAATAPVAAPSLYDAFTALLAAEKGQGPPPGEAGPAPAFISDELIEEIVGRVLARMADDRMRQAVLDTAERLVREEIERIKKIAD
jgi:hypothetical protein